eukprot:gene19475-biopygen13025
MSGPLVQPAYAEHGASPAGAGVHDWLSRGVPNINSPTLVSTCCNVCCHGHTLNWAVLTIQPRNMTTALLGPQHGHGTAANGNR